jgi:hypothetical protein
MRVNFILNDQVTENSYNKALEELNEVSKQEKISLITGFKELFTLYRRNLFIGFMLHML